MSDIEKILSAVVDAGRKASLAIMDIYRKGFDVTLKEDFSPVTDADLASDGIIRRTLPLGEDIAYLSEEEADDKSRLGKKALFIVDPLDGTQDFVEKDGSFSVNIAYVEDHTPIVGAIFLPVEDAYCYAVRGRGAFFVKDGVEERIHVSDRRKDLVYLASRTHENEKEKAVYERHADLIGKVERLGASMKGVSLACGKGDASIRYTGMTKEWDTCAMDLIVREAGGVFKDTELKPFVYNREDVYNRKGYCMFNRIENAILLD